MRLCKSCGVRRKKRDFQHVESKYLQSKDQALCVFCKRKLCMQRAQSKYRNSHRTKRNKESVEWRKKNPKRMARNNRKWHIKARYGISLDDYNEMFKAQNGCCAICGKHQSQHNHRLYVDHNHITGKVRALLCRNCNIGLGHFKDSPELLETAASYVRNSI